MSKLAGFFKKPLALVLCLIALGLGLVAIIVPCALPHGGTYTGTSTTQVADKKVETDAKYVFKDGKVTAYVDDKKAGTYEYAIYKGRLSVGTSQKEFEAGMKLLKGKAVDEALKTLPKINGLTISMKDPTGGDTTTLYCVTNIVFLAIGCLVAVVGAAGTALSLTLYLKDKKQAA